MLAELSFPLGRTMKILMACQEITKLPCLALGDQCLQLCILQEVKLGSKVTQYTLGPYCRTRLKDRQQSMAQGQTVKHAHKGYSTRAAELDQW